MSLWHLRHYVGRSSLGPGTEGDHQVKIVNVQTLEVNGAAAPVAGRWRCALEVQDQMVFVWARNHQARPGVFEADAVGSPGSQD